jgi:hypothetical protein
VGRALLCASAASFWAESAIAVSQTFSFVSGQAHITANIVGQTTFLVDEVVALDGTFVDFETAPVGVPDLQLSLAPTGPIAMSGTYGGYDTFVIESAFLVPSAGFSSAGILVSGSEYSVTMGPIDVNAVYSASDSTLVNPPASNVPISFTNPSLTATVDADLITFEMIGVTLGVIPGALLGEASDLIVKGDIIFVGAVPEPTTGALLGLGLFGLALSRSHSSRMSRS